MEHTQLIRHINKDLAIELPDQISFEELRSKLASHFNYLIQTDFNRLVAILYRIDVSEPRLKQLLQENPEDDAGEIIALLVIDRQIQKIKIRQEFTKKDENISEDEKW